MTMSSDERDEEFTNGPQAGGHPAAGGEGPMNGAPGGSDVFGYDGRDENAQLDLGDEETALPWLDGDDQEEYEEGGSGQMFALLALGLLAIVLVIGGIWWISRGSGDMDKVADGSTIAAPSTPYKEKPKDPEGKTFEGTGDSSYAVSQGEVRPARLGEQTPAAKPGFTTIQNGSAAKESAKPASPAASASATKPAAESVKGVGVQVAAYSKREQAETGWNTLTSQYEALSGLRHRVVEGEADIGTVYRLQALANTEAEARALCNRLRDAGLNCQVKK